MLTEDRLVAKESRSYQRHHKWLFAPLCYTACVCIDRVCRQHSQGKPISRAASETRFQGLFAKIFKVPQLSEEIRSWYWLYHEHTPMYRGVSTYSGNAPG
ncbi:uncharacterized protein AKAW2_60997S [Aspergillus luchuensis]|uniref:Uncharacterized protein n=1 Tax=Aspergillus kawachii TaxID=1069201 RepID=A0A7R7WGT7_ASPKA|nr:uncharacterized protein AKAW2_60997S [Aspergillus luchuensis]BCS02733.1 hypothetical protein AKAW2_60997S [Aspergillus luchuensis]